MRALLINVVCGIGSTGRICTDLAKELETQGYEVKIAYGRERVPDECQRNAVRIGNDWDVRIHGVLTRLFDIHGNGSASRGATRRFLQWVDTYDPDLLWLHNLHGYYLNYELLFKWIRQRQSARQALGKPLMEIKWTLHDCWAFTGHCSHYMACGCEKWKGGCHIPCPEKRSYPAALGFSRAADNYQLKKQAFTGIPHLTLITPSKWLKGEVAQSFLRGYPIEVAYNRIDTSVFKPTPSDIRERLGLTEKRILLGVAGTWSEKKGLSDYLKLTEELDTNTVIVLVGIDPDGKQARSIRKHLSKAASERLVLLPKTHSRKKLAELYTAADIFLNLTHEDNYPTVNLEAEACGTRVITYDVGGCKETIKREDSVAVEPKAIHDIAKELTMEMRTSIRGDGGRKTGF